MCYKAALNDSEDIIKYIQSPVCFLITLEVIHIEIGVDWDSRLELAAKNVSLEELAIID